MVKRIFVGNLDFSAREDELRQLFESYGAVDSVRILTDRDTGRSRGFGFVEMATDSEADAAISALDSRDWNGRALRVNEALPKTEGGGGGRPFGGGGGFGRGGGRPGGGGGGGGRGGRGGGGGGGGRKPRW
ncbi:MAG: RNA-binding protein [Acidobacteria bacterium]|nr:RNA-binding protein [Acidobacteriota bacterium]